MPPQSKQDAPPPNPATPPPDAPPADETASPPPPSDLPEGAVGWYRVTTDGIVLSTSDKAKGSRRHAFNARVALFPFNDPDRLVALKAVVPDDGKPVRRSHAGAVSAASRTAVGTFTGSAQVDTGEVAQAEEVVEV